MSTPIDVQPFTVSISEEVLDDLKFRLDRTRWADQVDGAGWDYGTDLEFLQHVVRYWRHDFDWRAQETRINSYPNHRATINGFGLHFIHLKGTGRKPIPILLVHGWPSSFIEMLDLADMLANPAAYGGDPEDGLDVVIPAVPGYAFSDRPTAMGYDYRRVAALFLDLMTGLGYDRFGVHTYDIGRTIMTHLLLDHPDRLIGYHTSEPGNPPPYLGPGSPPLTDAEIAFQDASKRWSADEGGYSALQTTRPQSLGYGLNDSPAGMAAWILEKWHAWTGSPTGSLLDRFTLDQLLTNVTLYWVTETMNSANRLYYERAHNPRVRLPEDRIDVPLGVALGATQPNERPPREYIERLFTNIQHWVELGRGGHFAALEEPEIVAESIRSFFRLLR